MKSLLKPQFRIIMTKLKFLFTLTFTLLIAGCGGGGGGDRGDDTIRYAVSTSVGTGGNVSPTSQTVASGSTTSFTVTPDTGYGIDAVTGCSGALAGTIYTTGAITAACMVTASFSLNSYEVAATAGTGGSIGPANATVSHGATTSFTVTPDTGYGIDAVTGCGGALAGTTYITGAITAACAVTASFSLTSVNPNSYEVAATAGTGGSISPANAAVSHGATTSFTVIPDTGYSIDAVIGCSGALAGTSYTTGVITAACTVTASFVPTASIADASVVEPGSGSANLTFTVKLSAPANGDVTLDYATSDDTAIGGAACGDGVDYVTTSDTLTIFDGTLSNTIDVEVCSDSAIESNETFTLTLSNVSANATLGDLVATGTIIIPMPLNDTGITRGGNYPFGDNATCIGETIDQQDCAHGRDATHDDDSDGHAGFSFTKLDDNGNPLVSNSDEWACVKDNVTGLIWEEKTAHSTPDLRDKDWTYMNTTNMTSWDPRTVYDNGTCFASSSNSDGVYCHTEGYKDAVNAQGLCGASDWRLPTNNELMSLVNYGRFNPAIDSNYFRNRNDASFYVWSGSPDASGGSRAWDVYFFEGTVNGNRLRSDYLPVRLVRSGGR